MKWHFPVFWQRRLATQDALGFNLGAAPSIADRGDIVQSSGSRIKGRADFSFNLVDVLDTIVEHADSSDRLRVEERTQALRRTRIKENVGQLLLKHHALVTWLEGGLWEI